MIVTPEPPVNVVKSAQTAATITAMPPGIQPKSARKNRTSRVGGAALGEHVAARGQQRDGRQRRRGDQPVDLGRDGRHRRAVAEEQQQRDAAHGDEHRRAEQRRARG